MPKAAPSTRASNHITLSFGMFSAPVSIYTGTVSDHGFSRHEYLPVTDPATGETVDHPVGRGQIDKTTGELLGPDKVAQVQRKIDTEYGPVFVEDDEIEKLFTIDADTLKIIEFQPQHLFSPQGNYVPKTLAFLEPTKVGSGKKKGPSSAAVKLLHTLYKAMREEGVVAVGELTTRGVPKPVVITPDGKVWHVWHTDALREQRDLPEFDVIPAEVTMTRTFIQALTTTDPVDLTDKRSELIQNFADEKAAAGDFSKPADTYVAPAAEEPSIDFAAMMQASIEAAKAAKEAS